MGVGSASHIEISFSEDLIRQKDGKATGPDHIPCEVLKNEICVRRFLNYYSFFYVHSLVHYNFHPSGSNLLESMYV